MQYDWYIHRASKKAGPFTAQQLKQLAKSGKLFPRDVISIGASGRQVQARNVKGLVFTQSDVDETPQASRIETPQSPPPTATETMKQPYFCKNIFGICVQSVSVLR